MPTSSSAASSSPAARRLLGLVKKSMLKTMMPGSVIVDVAIDQGGCFETSKPTTHTDPTYVVNSMIHYCVANMPGAVARTSTMALTGATLPQGLAIANKGFEQAVKDDVGSRSRRQRLPWQAHRTPRDGRGPQDEVHAAGQSARLRRLSATRRPLAVGRQAD